MANRPRPATAGPRPAASHRRPSPRGSGPAGNRPAAAASGPLAWLPYLVVLAGAAMGMFTAWQGPNYAGRGAAILGGSLLAAALARMILPPRYAGLLSTRRKASDVLTFTVFGAAVLAVALMLP